MTHDVYRLRAPGARVLIRAVAGAAIIGAIANFVPFILQRATLAAAGSGAALSLLPALVIALLFGWATRGGVYHTPAGVVVKRALGVASYDWGDIESVQLRHGDISPLSRLLFSVSRVSYDDRYIELRLRSRSEAGAVPQIARLQIQHPELFVQRVQRHLR